MASFRILNQAPQYLLADGSVNAGGKLWFYETDLTTPKDTWSDEALSVLNSNPVVMDAAGRTLTDVWGDGEYGVVMTDSLDVVIWTRNNVKASGDPGTEIPALQAGEFLTNDGSFLLWQTIREVPDPSGHAGQQLGTDGTLTFWEAKATVPTLPSSGISNTTTEFRIGTLLAKTGTITFPATGTQQSSQTATFGGTAFSGAPVAVFLQQGPGSTMFNMSAVNSMVAANFNATIDSNLVGATITVPQIWSYLAIGPTA